MGDMREVGEVMNEGELRKYWSAYTDAWKLMKNRQIVNLEVLLFRTNNTRNV